ncbi:MAG TPA: hypothetical protein DCZ55_35220 [Cyanobacteria bacterium UBA11371]|nr:hypothetical protein [Cyanobacteria bacterium UBA11371]HBE33172.1 hypothetical protein [Cyanobacteria bacterium UBA11368]
MKKQRNRGNFEEGNFLIDTCMPSSKPRITLYMDEDDMDCLERWAKDEFLTVPQLTKVIVKRAIAEYGKQCETQTEPPHPGKTNKKGFQEE